MDHPMSEEAEMAMPINSTYVHSHPHLIQHHHHHHHHDQHSPQPFNHIIPSSNGTNTNTTMEAAAAPDQIAVIGNNSESFPTKKIKQSQQQQQQQQEVVVVKYRECLKNHAAPMGGNATDGCGEFMPSGEEGTIEALTCSACNCHRNFHRKEIEGGDHNQMMMMIPSPSSCDCYHHLVNNRGSLTGLGGGGGHGRKLIALPDHHHNHHSSRSKVIIDAVTGATAEPFGYSAGGHDGGGALIPAARSVPIMPFSSMAYLQSESDEQEGGGGGGGDGMGRVQTHQHHQNMVMKKRFRTKFTQEQKSKMFNFAEKVGWKIQKQEESVVQHFCEEIGVRRRVLKVWMHNNKHNLAKKQLHNSPSTA